MHLQRARRQGHSSYDADGHVLGGGASGGVYRVSPAGQAVPQYACKEITSCFPGSSVLANAQQVRFTASMEVMLLLHIQDLSRVLLIA